MAWLRSGLHIVYATIISRIFGLLRELFIAYTLGAGLQSDQINIAFRLPNLFRKIFAEGALSNVFIPIFSSLSEKSQAQAKSFFITVFFLLCLVLCILICIIEIFMPDVVLFIAPGFNLQDNHEVVLLCRITLPYLLLIAIMALINCVLNVYNRFFAFAVSPAILSIVIIITSSFFFRSQLTLQALAWAMPIAGVIQLFVLYLSYTQTPCYHMPWRLSPCSAPVIEFLKKMVPAATNASSTQLHLFLSQSLASFIVGGISVLSYADRIYQFPLSIIGGTISTLALPILSKLHSQNMSHAMEIMSQRLIKLSVFLTLPASFGVAATAQNIISVIYERGMFTTLDTTRVAKVTICFAFGLPAFVLTKVYNNIFYAKQNILAPFNITLCSLTLNLLFSFCFLNYLQELSVALGTTLSGWLQLSLLLYYRNSKHKNNTANPTLTTQTSLLSFALRACTSSVLMYFTIMIFSFYVQKNFCISTVSHKTIIVITQIILGIGVFLVCSLLNGQLLEIKRIIQHHKK